MEVYKNKNYKVVAVGAGYQVINCITGIIESREHCVLPRAIAEAIAWNDAINRVQQKEQEVSNVVDIGKPR